MIVGLTGGIGSGKTTVARMFEALGCAVFYSDDVAKNVYFNAEIKEKIIELLGEKAYLSDAEIDKKFIGSQIFFDEFLLQKLNNIIHPAVKIQFEKFKSDNRDKIIIKESALLFETGINNEMDKIIVVSASDELRIERILKRDGLTREIVLKKVNAQMPQQEKVAKADYVINNNEDDLLIPKIFTIFTTLSDVEKRLYS
jgi:dephospho-CoA kinase